MRILRSRKWRAALLTLGVLAACGGGALYRNWAAIEQYAVFELETYIFRSHRDPLLRDLATGTIRPGDSIEALIEAYPIRYVDRHDEFVTVGFGQPGAGGSVVIAAKHGRVVWAADSYGWYRHEFFNTLTPTEQSAYQVSHSSCLALEFEAWHDAKYAVGGAAAIAFDHGCYKSTPGD